MSPVWSAARSESGRADAGQGSAPQPPFRILVVEDEALSALYLCDVLFGFGHDVVGTADTAPAAVAAAAKHRPDLVLMDINLAGGSDGIEAATEIRNRLGIPSIFVTAYSDQTTRERARTAQPLDYLIKPVGVVAIRQALQRAAEKLPRPSEGDPGSSDLGPALPDGSGGRMPPP